MKAQVDSSSRGQKDFICREEKRKAEWGHPGGPGNQWSCGSGWRLGFIAFFVLPKGGDVSQVQTDISWEGEVSPCSVITCSFLQSVLQFPPLSDHLNCC
jgi:hypothetical protein